jgi:hypothetical protein
MERAGRLIVIMRRIFAEAALLMALALTASWLMR